MARAELSLIEERDETQRALGCVGFSAFAHVGLLIMILFAPSFRESAGIANGTKAGLELPGESISASAPAGVSLSATDTSAPVEVMLADANDPNAVALPSAQPQALAEAQPPVEAVKVEEVKTEAPVVAKAPEKNLAKAKPKAAKPVVEANEISSALTQARTEAAKNPAKPVKAAAVAAEAAPVATPIQESQIETADESDVAAPVAEAKQEEAPTQEPEEEAVPLEVALPESESLTQAQANELQSPNAIPAEAKPIETVPSVSSSKPAATTGMILTRPAGAAPVATATQPTAGTVSGATQSGGGNAGFGVPAGAQVRDARSLEAMPGNPLATYPLPDRLANRQGTAVLLGHVRNDGRIENITLEKSSGSRMMDESAAKAFSKWKYKPGQEGYVRLPMQFKLVGDAHIIPAELNRQ